MSSTPTIWLTGLSRSGKSTIAEGLAEWMTGHGLHVQVLDGRFVRDELGDFFGYSKDERIKVARVLAVMAKLLAMNGVHPIVTAITPYQDSRDFNRLELTPYLEIYIEASVETCIDRDHLGLYRKAQRGDLKHFIGVDAPYELPKEPDLTITTDHETPAESISRAIDFVSETLSAGE